MNKISFKDGCVYKFHLSDDIPLEGIYNKKKDIFEIFMDGKIVEEISPLDIGFYPDEGLVNK